MDDIYCYPNTEILRNKLNLKDDVSLNTAEKQITFARQLEILGNNTSIQKFDFDYLKSIHKKLFGDIYDWAGEPRTIDISKRGSMFCRAAYIESTANEIFAKLAKDNFLKGLPKAKFISKLAYYMGQINALHPFREGNGRTQRIFFEKLLNAAGYNIDLLHATR